MNEELIEMLRRANVFGAQSMPQQEMGGFGQRPPTNPYDVNFGGDNPFGSILASQYEDDPMEYTPEDKYSRMFADLLANQPNRENFKRSKWAKIAALIGGGLTGDFRSVNEVMHGNYDRAVGDWKQKVDVVGRAATDERGRNQQERMYAQSRQGAELRERDIRRKEEMDRTRAGIERGKLELATFRAKNPHWKLQAVRGGNVIAINPMDPKQTIDTGIATGTLSDLDKINLGLEADIEMEGVRQGNRVELEGVKQSDRRELIPLRESSQSRLINQRNTNTINQINQREGLIRTRPNNATNRGLSPSQQKVDLANRANALIAKYPQYAKYITIDPAGVRINAPGGWGTSSPDQKTYDALRNELFPSSPSGITANNQNARAVMMMGPDGSGPYEVPADKVADAEKRGMKRR